MVGEEAPLQDVREDRQRLWHGLRVLQIAPVRPAACPLARRARRERCGTPAPWHPASGPDARGRTRSTFSGSRRRSSARSSARQAWRRTGVGPGEPRRDTGRPSRARCAGMPPVGRVLRVPTRRGVGGVRGRRAMALTSRLRGSTLVHGGCRGGLTPRAGRSAQAVRCAWRSQRRWIRSPASSFTTIGTSQ